MVLCCFFQCCRFPQPHQDGPAYFPVVMDFSLHLRLRSGDDGISRDQGSAAESCVPERNNHFLHGISGSPTQRYKQVQHKALFYL
ncbi:unnamed protein product [Thlaspi arvense]|uniref:Secreted protein n=1 Tax=Thlaspi arvense TaxID=13288 RepID=A0AAU9RC98_THLAR|nr:unnamed protein product [Thlaspi arvense]